MCDKPEPAIHDCESAARLTSRAKLRTIWTTARLSRRRSGTENCVMPLSACAPELGLSALATHR